MDYTVTYLNLKTRQIGPVLKGLVNLLENHYAIMGTHELLVEQLHSCIAIYPKTGKIDAVIPKEGSRRAAEFRSSDPSSVRFNFDGISYVVNYRQKSNSESD
jgi:hypothetical protein